VAHADPRIKHFGDPDDTGEPVHTSRIHTVSQNLSTEEVASLLDAPTTKANTPAEVAPRDFRRPMRLSAPQLERLRRAAEKAIPEIESAFTTWLRRPHKVTIAAASEVDAHAFLASLEEPMCVVVFDCANQPAWTAWDSGAAVGAAELALGTSEVKPQEPRALSSIEAKLLAGLVNRVTAGAANSLNVEAKNFRFAQSADDLKTSREAIGASDPQRLCVQIALESAGETSTMRVYLPGVRSPDAEKPATNAKPAARAPLPAHLAAIPVDIEVQLGSTDLPLSELLGLEVGDVILLDVEVGSSLDVYVEGEACATARWGQHAGQLAIKIDALGARREKA
jgi:flagellar motor switch protein FliM